MIGADLEGADLESRVASWAASVISNDATAVRAVIKVYGDRLAATDVAGIVSRYPGNATSPSPAAVRYGTHGATGRSRSHVPADAGAVRRGLLRHLASPPPGFPHPLAGRRARRGSGYADIYLPVQGPCR
jgi:hypothetical protein